ncbi:MAG: cupin domain-containing protein [Candidatus Cloacimonetes bacterium]|nr:cupin domain-containing protein [Candidatus Cloacimonadota bacterium]
MKLINYKEVQLEDVDVEGAKGTKIRWLISQKEKAPNFAMRMFELEPGGHTPYHTHSWEHEVFCLEGEGLFVSEWGERSFKVWDVIYVDPNTDHQFKNNGESILRFLCIIPHDKPVKKVVNPFASGRANNC